MMRPYAGRGRTGPTTPGYSAESHQRASPHSFGGAGALVSVIWDAAPLPGLWAYHLTPVTCHLSPKESAGRAKRPALMFRASLESLPEPSSDEPKREGLGPIHKTR